jgi:hypothetical protein
MDPALRWGVGVRPGSFGEKSHRSLGVFGFHLQPHVSGQSILPMFVSVRKLSMPAASRQPCAHRASDMLPNWRIVTGGEGEF